MVKTGEFKETHPRNTCPDGFLSIYKDVPYPLPGGLVIQKASKGKLGDLLPEEFATLATHTIIKHCNGEGLAHEEQSLLDWVQPHMFWHHDGNAKCSVFPIDEIPLAGGDAGCQHLIWINGSRHLRIFKVI